MVMTDLDSEQLLKGDERIVAEAQRRFKACEEYEAETRRLELEDIKFVHGNSDNRYQWPQDILSRIQKKPVLTVNKTRVQNLLIINNAKQNKTEMRVRPTGGGATFKSAQVFEGILRYIQYISNAQAVFGYAFGFQVNGGVGYWRIVTDYSHDETFDQDIFIRKIKNPNSVYLDTNTNTGNELDRKFAFVFDDMPHEEFKEQYPGKWKDVGNNATFNNSANSWLKKDTIRVCEYFRVVTKKDTLLHIKDDNSGQYHNVRASDLHKDLRDIVMSDDTVSKRPIESPKVEWFLIAGNKIVDRRDWLGRYIPIVRVIGEEIEIEGRLHRAGHTRYLKDPQRMYNYFTSAAVEGIALQTKTPWVAPKAAIEDSINYWKKANTENFSVLPWKHIDKEGRPIPAPFRVDGPKMAEGYIQGMQTAANEMMMASGQYQENMGEQSNAISGKAINERQRPGETATYHFTENQGTAIGATAEILLDLVPKVYDVERIVKILAKDGSEETVKIVPNAPQAQMDAKITTEIEEIKSIFNPNVGRYSVQADIGPAYATQRQEAFNAISQILQQNQQLTAVIGDLLFKNADFPGADEIAERLANMVPPQAKGEGDDPMVQQLNGQIQNMQKQIGVLLEELASEKMKLKGKDQQKDIDAYEALTKRIDVLQKNMVNPKDIAQMMHELMMEEHKVSLQPVVDASANTLQQDANE